MSKSSLALGLICSYHTYISGCPQGGILKFHNFMYVHGDEHSFTWRIWHRTNSKHYTIKLSNLIEYDLSNWLVTTNLLLNPGKSSFFSLFELPYNSRITLIDDYNNIERLF